MPSLNLRRTPSSPSPSAYPSRLPSLPRDQNHAQPTELLILAHGLQGTVDDFNYLLDQLHASPAVMNGRVLIHASRVNTDKTHDGVAFGGLRLAEDIRAVVAQHPSLETISMMGFSLGGLYVRYAAAVLYDGNEGTVAGLKAGSLFVVASPNLGVRSFGVYRFVPGLLLPWMHVLFGETVVQMMLRDEEGLLMAMTTDRNRFGVKFLSALSAFERRVLYANVRNDFMVNYGTAALDHRVQVMGGGGWEEVVGNGGGRKVDEGYDERGCRICFETVYEKGAVDGMGSGGEEEVMSRRLKGVGWKVIGVDFPVMVPIAHNRIVAMSRNGLHSWLNASGRRVVHHLVDEVVGGWEEHEPTFKQVVGRAVA